MVAEMASLARTTGDEDGDGTPPVVFEELTEVEKAFEDVDIWLMRENYVLTQPIYAKRDRIIRRIPNFWAIVMEEAPEEIDRRIQPCDTSALSALQSIDVTRFEVSASAPHVGEPRSVKIGLEFGENAWFTDRRLEKTFWHRRAARDGWTGLVSEPVRIRWKEGKDLTEGLLDDAVCIFELGKELKKEMEHQAGGHGPGGHHQGQLSTLHQQHVQNLVEKLQRMPQDAVSFFAWFGYRGREVSAEESAEAIQREEKDRQRWKNTDNAIVEDGHEAEDEKKEEELGDAVEEEEEEEKEEEEAGDSTYDIYPAGEDLAIAISEDLFPGAIKYFIQSLKDDRPGSDEESDMGSASDGDSKEYLDTRDEPTMKKQKTTV